MATQTIFKAHDKQSERINFVHMLMYKDLVLLSSNIMLYNANNILSSINSMQKWHGNYRHIYE